MRDKNIWIFNSGSSFDGNPKWLFLYIVNYRKDIKPYWFCYDKECLHYIRRLGFPAYLFDSKEARKIGTLAGVYVVNQNKEVFQDYLKGITVLNLWHGVGCKSVEKGVLTGFLNERIIKKWIENMSYYKKYQLFLVTSPLMESHFSEQCDIDEDKLIRAGYPLCCYPGNVQTFDHRLLKNRNLPSDTKIAVYAPTYRDASATDFFAKAVPDMDALIRTLEREGFVLILKLHPKMSRDFQYQNIRRRYLDCPRLIFWDNADDFYEVMDQIDLAIVDYSSIFYDMLAKGVKNFIRYIFDYDSGNMRDFALDYKEMTCGKICCDFEELLSAFSSDYHTDEEELYRIKDLFWSYANEDSMEQIIKAALEFEPDPSYTLPTLYSFDIFDTLIGRTTLVPKGVFYYVQDKMRESAINYPVYVVENFYKIRGWAESNMREYYKKSLTLRESTRTEIAFDMIYDRIQELYALTDEQIRQLKEWELECEYQTSIPYPKNIKRAEDLVKKGETVILISDMHLPKEFIRKLLEKASPVLSSLPLFLSSDCGTQKTTKQLFFDAYHAMDYHFGEWIHCGDNASADGKIPQSLSIQTVNHVIPIMDAYEKNLTTFALSYDSYQVSALFARFRSEGHTEEEEFAYCYASLYFVPYVNWALEDAVSKGVACLYFISRDGYHLKRIADAIIEEKSLPVKTKYIYGSRKAWRVPAQIGEIDGEFFTEYGQLSGIISYESLLDASCLSEEQFSAMFPELDYLKKEKNFDADTAVRVREAFAASEKYRKFLLDLADQKRPMVLRYLRQEIDFSEKFAFVEYWGRGYTQTCLGRLLNAAEGKDSKNIFYYFRSIYPSRGNDIRVNFTGNPWSLLFTEAIFANLPYQTVVAYEEKEGSISPVLLPKEYDRALHQAMETYLVLFAKDFSGLTLENEEAAERCMADFGFSYFYNHQTKKIFLDMIAPLYYSEGTYGNEREFAPAVTLGTLRTYYKTGYLKTGSKGMSFARASRAVCLINRLHKKIHALSQRIKRLGG